jgi:hypothetical protein
VKQLTGRRLEIATTGGGLTPEQVAVARESYRSHGFEVPEWQGEPGFIAKVINYAKAVAADVKAGRPRVSDELFTTRMAVCRECGLFKAHKVKCGHPACGCNLKEKARWASMECPIGRWGKQA